MKNSKNGGFPGISFPNESGRGSRLGEVRPGGHYYPSLGKNQNWERKTGKLTYFHGGDFPP